MHVLAPADALAADPLPGAVAQVALREAAGAGPAGPALPQGAERFAVAVDGTESEDELARLQVATLAPARRGRRMRLKIWRRPGHGALSRAVDANSGTIGNTW